MTPVNPSVIPNPKASEGWRWRRALCLLGVALALFLPGFFSLQPMDRDEPRFAQATRQMLETGDYIAIRFQGEARNKKPVGIYWLQAAVVSLGQSIGIPNAQQKIWLYRTPSLLGALATVLLTYWAGVALAGEAAAFLGALLLASTILLGVEARLAKTDAVMAATVVAAMGVLARYFLANAGKTASWRLPAIFWTAIGVGILVKGPITPMVPLMTGVTLVVWRRSAGWLRGLRPLAGLAWTGLLVAPWLVLIMVATHGAFLSESVGQDMLGKVAAGQEAHGAPPGAYIASFFAAGWPMAPLAALAAPFVWRQRREPAVAFLLAWLIPAWLLFEAVPTKLPHYVLPLYPAIALLTGLAITRGALALSTRWSRALLWGIPGLAVLLVVVGAAAAITLKAPPGWLYFVAAPVLLWQAWRVVTILRQPAPQKLPGAAAWLAGFTYLMAYGGVMTGPVFAPLAMSPRLAAAAASAALATPGCASLAPATSGFREPSLVFLTRTDLEMTTGAGAADFLADAPCRLAFVESRDAAAFAARLAERLAAHPSAPDDIRLVSHVEGVNLNGGRRLDIGLYVRQGKPQ